MPADASCAGEPVQTLTPLLPLALGGSRLPLRSPPPSLGQHTLDLLAELGFSTDDIQRLIDDGVVRAAAPAQP